ncbi:ThiF family adenylyltransferase [bacterium]|nr:ThiF family adenylyltransferase [bacterium]
MLLCRRRQGERRHRLVVREVFLIPHNACSLRTEQIVRWPTDLITDVLNKAEDAKLSVILIHSHPSGYPRFSDVDDRGDGDLIPAIASWVEADVPHGSAIMLPDGTIFGRYWMENGFAPMGCVNVVGDDLHYWYTEAETCDNHAFLASHAQIFGEGTTQRLNQLSIAVVGCSGTGSPLIEQLARLGVGELVLVDDDHVEERNLNRIYNSTLKDAHENRFKVDVLADSVERIGLGTRVIRLPYNLWDKNVILEVAQCDIVFGCMDSIDGRFLLNALATHYTQAYFDLGVHLDTYRDGPKKGNIREVCGTIHYLQPGQSSLLSRGLITMEGVRAAGLARHDPTAYNEQLNDGYIAGVEEHRPAVISVNSYLASLAVNELLARIHPFREENNSEYASVTFSLSSMELLPEAETEKKHCLVLTDDVGMGDRWPPLGLMELAI